MDNEVSPMETAELPVLTSVEESPESADSPETPIKCLLNDFLAWSDMTQSHFAKAARIDLGSISQYCRGKANPKRKSLEKLQAFMLGYDFPIERIKAHMPVIVSLDSASSMITATPQPSSSVDIGLDELKTELIKLYSLAFIEKKEDKARDTLEDLIRKFN